MRNSYRLLKLCRFLAVVFPCFAQSAAGNWIPSDAARVSPAELHSFLEMICPGRTTPSGCEACPEGTSLGGSWTWEVRTTTFGHFLAPASDDALISGYGCEPHADGYSGSFLFTRDGSSFRKVRYLEGVKAWDCKKLAGSDGRDRLLCAADDGHQGFEDTFVYLLDPGRDPGTIDPLNDTSRGDIIFDVLDGLGALCGPPNAYASQYGVIERVAFQGLPKGPQVRIFVYTRLGKATVPAKVTEKACRQTGFPSDLKITTVPRRYEFTFDGAKVVPAEDNPPMMHMMAVAPRTSYIIAK